ncbi:hypothetical protein KRP22_012928 [Phytophthora ramorum]|nr:hypothetical protein KRP22_8642 [Phytophthora ramorum]
MAAFSPCGGCGELVGNVHVCPVCQISMHTWCGTPEGPEGFGQKIMCPKCLAHERSVSITSASPIIAAFDTMARQATTSNGAAVKSTVTGNNIGTTNAGEDGASAVITAEHGRTVVIFASKRKRQDVSTVSKRRAVVMWMQEQHELGETALAKAAVDHFPEVFNNEKSRDSDRRKASRWWAERGTLTDLPRGSRTVSKVTPDGRKVLEVKALPGRGRPQSEWVSWLYPELLSEFTHLRKAGLQFDTPLLRQLAIRTVEQATGKFNKQSRDHKGVTIIERLTNSWIQYFMEKHGIVLRSQTGKKQVSE